MKKSLISIGGLLAALALFLAVNVLAGAGLGRARVDLTEGKLFTLSQGSKNIARSLDEPVKLTLYYSESQSSEIPANYKAYGQRVKEVLREYALASGGKVRVEVVNPEPFSDAEDRAVQAGLMGAPVGRTGQERFYFGLVGLNSTDKQQVIPFFRPDREEFLEYELTRMIYLLSDPRKQTIGLMSWLPVEGTQGNPMMGPQSATPPWQVIAQAKEVFDVRTIERDVAEIPADIKVLLLIHPKSVSEKVQYAIDQFVLRGGRLLAFVDPICEADVPPGINPMQAMQLPRNSGLPKLFEAWGIELVDGKFAADRQTALRVSAGSQGRPEMVNYVAWLGLQPDNLDKSDSVTGQLKSLNVATAGVLRKKDGATTQVQPLVHTGTDSMLADVTQVQFMPDPKKLLADFKPGDQELTLAARITGPAKTAFPNGRLPEPPKPPKADGSPADPPAPEPVGPQLKESTEPINVIVVADCDMLQDRFWVQEVKLNQQIVLGYDKFADNGDLLINALDNLTGSSDLISVRARGRFTRPFDKVKQIQKDAEQQYLAKEQELQTKLRSAEARIQELQRQRPDAADSGSAALLTPEQQAEIEKARAEVVSTRKELRNVQHQLRKDVERLETRVRLANIGVMPLLVGCAAVGLSAWRISRRRVDRSTVTPRS